MVRAQKLRGCQHVSVGAKLGTRMDVPSPEAKMFAKYFSKPLL
jgi:hypothetical protein